MTNTRHNLPRFPTTFIGRESEIGEIVARLDDTACQLLTLVGPGGVGKTRLAVEVAHRMANDAATVRFPQEVYFVPLQSLGSPDHILPALAEAIDFEFARGGDPQHQLLDYLREKALLLVLDNFEHLPEGVMLVSEILAHASRVKILATSRETLSLHEEWLYQVKGMSFPVDNDVTVTDIEHYSAIQLFIQNARRVQPDFSLTDEQVAVRRICQLVEGLPLALEMTAAWLKRLPCREVVRELERGLDILESPVRNIADRHRSIRAVFAHSWAMLIPKEQRVFKALSVFRGGFRREGAEAVAGASLTVFSSLVDKSLLRVEADGRYDLHELLRQYGEEQLDLEPEAGEAVRDRHCEYYAEFMGQWEADLKGRRQLAALNEIEADFENVRAAWLWALRQQDTQAISSMVESLSLFCQMRNRYVDGKAMLRQALEAFAVETGDVPTLIWRQVFGHWVGLRLLHEAPPPDIEAIRAQIERNLALARQHGEQAEVAFCLWLLGFMGHWTQNYTDAIKPLEDSFAQYRALGDRYAMAKVADFLADDYAELGQRDRADHFNQLSLDLRRKLGDRFGVALILHNLVIGMFVEGHYAELEDYLNEIDAIHSEMGNRVWQIRNRVFMAWYAFLRGDFDKARLLLSPETIEILPESIAGGKPRAMDILGKIANMEEDYLAARQWYEKMPEPPYPFFGLMIAAVGLGDYSEAERLCRDWLALGVPAHVVTGWLAFLPIVALPIAHAGDLEWAAELLGLAFHHPASATGWLEKWPLLNRLRDRLETELGVETYAAAWERGQTLNLDEVIVSLRAGFGVDVDAQQEANAVLDEPLTPRELEVLTLIYAGHSNREIADELVLAESTVKRHINHIYSKLAVESRTQALARARELGLLD